MYDRSSKLRDALSNWFNQFQQKNEKKTGYDEARIRRDRNKEGHPDLQFGTTI